MENNFLFLDLQQAVSNLNEKISGDEKREYLMIVLSDDAMSVSHQIAKATGIIDVLSLDGRIDFANRPTSEIQFDFDVVKESKRDVPQDFVFHEERNLKANMVSLYNDIYKDMTAEHPGRAVILVDSLTSDGAEFHQARVRLDGNKTAEAELVKPEVSNVTRRFVYLHLIQGDGDGINIIIENGLST